MNNKKIFNQIQNDLKISNPIIINNNDNFSNLKKNFGSKYSEDISDSDNDDLSSYKKRNSSLINQMIIPKSEINLKEKERKNINIINNNEINSNDECSQENADKDNDKSEGSEEIEYEFTEEFKEKVKTYVKNDDKIRELQIELKKLNTEKKLAETEVLKHLERLGQSYIPITGGKLRINQYESKDGLKEAIIKEALNEKIKDPKIIETIFSKINEKRTAKSKINISLKRTFERNKK